MRLMMVFLLPFSALEMMADDNEQIKKIPIWEEDGPILRRDLVQIPIASYAWILMASIYTCVIEDLGEIEIIVTNTSTGESWSNIFDSSIEPQSFLRISGATGYYEITYIIESGDVYYGEFTIL